MSESLSSQEEPRGEDKLFGKHKWRGKIFSTDNRSRRATESLESTDHDLANFLHTVGTRPDAGPVHQAPVAPPTDITAGARQPSAASVDQNDTTVDVYRRPKPRQNKGLRVRFESAPSVIGIGGDEAELPSRDVFRSFAGPVTSEGSPKREQSSYNANDHSQVYGRSNYPHDETSFQPSSLRRRPTRIDDGILAEESYHAGHDREAVQSAFSGLRKLSPQPRNEEQDLDMGLREGDARDFSDRPMSRSGDLSYDQSSSWQTAGNRRQGVTRHLDVPPPQAQAGNSLTPSESLETSYVSQEACLSSYYFPTATKDLLMLPNSRHQGVRQDFHDASHPPEDGPLCLRSGAESLGDESLDHFDLRVRRFKDLFRLNASAHVDVTNVPFEQWVRVSAWWFLRGRGGLESALRGKPSANALASGPNDGEIYSTLKQGYVNLAKAWWISKDIIPNLPVLRRFDNASPHEYSFQHAFNDDVDEKNGRLPPDDLQMQRLESQIFLDTPTFPSDIAALTVNNIFDSPTKNRTHVANPFFPILVGDTERHFSFGKMFVDVSLVSRDDAESGLFIPCVVTILRERSEWAVKAALASQDGQVNLVIQSGEHGGLNWHHVQWKIPRHTMQLGLAEDIYLQIKFSEKDYKTIWGICDYTQRIRKEYSGRGEEVLYERELSSFQCFDSPSFPAYPIKNCRVRFFERYVSAMEGRGHNRAHDGHRLMVITPPAIKALSKANYQLGKDRPILFGIHGSKGGHTLLVRVPSSLKVSLTFHEASDAELFRSTLAGTSITEDDHCSASLQLHNFIISSASADQDMAFMNASRCVSDLRWYKLRIVNKGQPVHDHDSQSKARLENLRILVDCDCGTFTDRISAEPGELQLNLSVENLNEINLLRAAQQDMTWGFTDGALREADLKSLSHLLHSIGTSPSVTTYHFQSLSDLHSFQAMLTGFHVLYDGLASTLSISRPRMVVPMHKRWEASTPRLQIIKQDKIVQLVAFFKDFSHGACMNFVLKVTDSFDIYSRSGIFFLRIADAKFALPKGESDPAREFVCLDLPEYPSEHDDIIIGFDNEPGKHMRRLIGSHAKKVWTNDMQTEIN
ncbi:hypothetical protein IMSHALPRED_008656 [Imshaugia aleurites]|uniref:Uncharacterized protein n=1 Tax=Imshaugia aleurites TaxID=172621 RepID=A0A8H3FYI8_9LECA|nr:hypothetical protein IMSHALPRED_008656 [Imshaugia aleurites]